MGQFPPYHAVSVKQQIEHAANHQSKDKIVVAHHMLIVPWHLQT